MRATKSKPAAKSKGKAPPPEPPKPTERKTRKLTPHTATILTHALAAPIKDKPALIAATGFSKGTVGMLLTNAVKAGTLTMVKGCEYHLTPAGKQALDAYGESLPADGVKVPVDPDDEVPSEFAD